MKLYVAIVVFFLSIADAAAHHFIVETYDEVVVIEAENWSCPWIYFIRDGEVVASRIMRRSPLAYCEGESTLNRLHDWTWTTEDGQFVLSWQNEDARWIGKGWISRKVKFKKFTSFYMKVGPDIAPKADLKMP